MKRDTRIGPGLLAPCGTALALIACYGTLAVVGLLSLARISVSINEGIWAAAIVLFALLALVGLFLSWRRHRRIWPVVLGIVGVGVIVFTMGVAYNRVVEFVGFAVLVGAVILDWRAKRGPPPPS